MEEIYICSLVTSLPASFDSMILLVFAVPITEEAWVLIKT